MISVERIFYIGCLNKIKSKYFGHPIPHPIYNPNPISRAYLCKYDNKPVMLSTVNLDDKVYISTLINSDYLYDFNLNIDNKLAIFVEDMMHNFVGDTALMSNSLGLLSKVKQRNTDLVWKNQPFDDVHMDTNEFNNNYFYMYNGKPITIICKH